MSRPISLTEPLEPSLRRWSSPDGAASGWPPVVQGNDAWDRGLKRLTAAAEDPAFSALHLVADDSELAVRRVVHGFAEEAGATRYAIEIGLPDYTVQPTRGLPSALRQDAP